MCGTIQKLDGQPRRRLDTFKAEKEFGFNSTVSLKMGLEETLSWYLDNQVI